MKVAQYLLRRIKRWVRSRRWLPCWLIGHNYVFGSDYGAQTYAVSSYCPKCGICETEVFDVC